MNADLICVHPRKSVAFLVLVGAVSRDPQNGFDSFRQMIKLYALAFFQ
jgi:hypothetical protein